MLYRGSGAWEIRTPCTPPVTPTGGGTGSGFTSGIHAEAPFLTFTGGRPEKQKSWSWGCTRTERHKVEVIEEELWKLVRCSLDGVRVFHTLYSRRVAPLVERTQPMWMNGGRSNPDRASLEDLPDDEVWSCLGWVL